MVFGRVDGERVVLSDAGEVVKAYWREIPTHFPYVALDEFVVMPNHIHAIVHIMDNDARAGQRPAPTARRPLSQIIGRFKSFSANRVNKILGTTGSPLWQRDYYERVIRDEYELFAVKEYIKTNPVKWEADGENPERKLVPFVGEMVIR